jgi:hypothetical protein
MLNIYLCILATYTVVKKLVIIQVISKTLSVFSEKYPEQTPDPDTHKGCHYITHRVGG